MSSIESSDQPSRGNVLVDVDNTINNLQRSLLLYANKKLSIPESYRGFTSERMESTTSVFDEIAEGFFNSPELLMGCQPFLGSLEAVRLLKDSNFNIHVASGRHAKLYQTTVDWLEKHGFLPHISSVNLKNEGQTSGDFKLSVAQKLEIPVAFDDEKSVAEVLAAGGITVKLIRRPWNKEVRKSDFIHPSLSFYRAVRAYVNTN